MKDDTITNLQNLIATIEWFQIYSDITKNIYIDQERCAYLFQASNDARAFVSKNININIGNSEQLKPKDYFSLLRSLGAKKLAICTKGAAPMVVDIPMNATRFYYYNEDTNFNLCSLRQYGLKKYLIALKQARFLIPLIIDSSSKYPSIKYCFANMKGSDTPYYCLFTDIDNFDIWNQTECDGKWQAIEIGLAKLDLIRKDASVIINPGKDNIILTNKQIECARKG